MAQQSKSSKADQGQVQLTDNLSHLMWNGAQREKAWVDGKLESQGMRISRSVSFDSAVKITENIKMQEMLAKQEVEDLWTSKKIRLYIIPFGYQSSSGRRKGSVRVQVKDEKHVEVKVRCLATFMVQIGARQRRDATPSLVWAILLFDRRTVQRQMLGCPDTCLHPRKGRSRGR